MKNSMTILSALIMAFVFYHQVTSITAGFDIPNACCYSYSFRKIPLARVVNFYETSSQCSLPAIIFLTKKGYQACANPHESWVQKYMKELKRRKS